MIEKKYRDLARKNYLASSKKFIEVVNTTNELKTLVTEYIQNTLTPEAIEYAGKYPDRIAWQGDLDFEYELDCPWGYRYLLSNGLVRVDLSSLSLPRLYPSRSSIFDEDGDFYKTHKDFVEKLKKLLKKISNGVKQVGPEVSALESALEEKSMNKTSIQKFYPELYKLIYD